jgi:hypothetical protein
MRPWSFIQNEIQVAEIRPVDGDCPAKLEGGAHWYAKRESLEASGRI